MTNDAHDERLIAGLTAMVRGVALPTANAAPHHVHDVLVAAGIAPEDIAPMLAHGAARLLAYRDLVRNRLDATIRGVLIKTTRVRGEAMDRDVVEFLSSRGPATHRMADVADEFVAWATPVWAAAREVPAYLADLANLEASLRAVRYCDALPLDPGTVGHLAPDEPVTFCRSARLLRLEHTVHLVTRDNVGEYVPELRPVSLLLYRRARDGAARFYRVAEALAPTLDRLLDGTPLAQALLTNGAARSRSVSPDPIALARLLDALRDRGVVAL